MFFLETIKMINSDTHRLRVVHVKKFKILKIEVLSEEKPKIEGQEKAFAIVSGYIPEPKTDK